MPMICHDGGCSNGSSGAEKRDRGAVMVGEGEQELEHRAQKTARHHILQNGNMVASHDILFHTLYGGDLRLVFEFVYAMACRLYSLTECHALRENMQRIIDARDGPNAPAINQLLSLFFLFLNVDMPMKEYVCDPQDIQKFAAALNLAPNDNEHVRQRHSYSMIATKPISHAKARIFFRSLKNLAQMWLSNEQLGCADFVYQVRQEYLVS